MKPVLLAVCSIFLFSNLFAQKSNMKWGKIPKEDLAMTSYEADPDAEAVVLGEYGSITFELTKGEINYVLEYHKRIKILDKSAFSRGDISIPYYSKDKFERIGQLKAQVFTPQGKKIAIKDFYEEEINDNYSVKKFAAPNLEVGSVIEYKYNKSSQGFFYLEEWYFQEDIPVRVSELHTEIPEWYYYVAFTQGRKAEVESSEITRPIAVPGVQYGANGMREQAGFDMVDARMNRKTYRMENIPALKSENYITTMRDYYAKIQFQLQGVKYPNSYYEDVTSTWAKLGEDMMDSNSFGDQINKKKSSKKLWEAIETKVEAAESDEEKISILHHFISNSMKWNGKYTFWVDETLDDAFANGSANSGEFNLAMIALCRQAGIDAHPVLLSTRSHGKMLPYYPQLSQFNHVLAYISVDDGYLLLDVGAPNRPPNLLRVESLNYTGWLVKPGAEEWIKIDAPANKEICLATFALNADGQLEGTIDRNYHAYSAIQERSDCSKNPDYKNVKEAWSEIYPDIRIDSVLVKNEDNVEQPFSQQIYCQIPDAAQSSGEFIYLSPVINAMDENPLKLEKREFAVDIPYQTSQQYILNLTIPSGYAIEELPEAVNIMLPEKGGKFQFFVSNKGDTVQLVSRIKISQLHFEPEEYEVIKNFFDIIIEKQSEQIVLKKTT